LANKYSDNKTYLIIRIFICLKNNSVAKAIKVFDIYDTVVYVGTRLM